MGVYFGEQIPNARDLEILDAIKKYGKDGTSSGRVLGDILGKVFSSKKKKNKD